MSEDTPFASLPDGLPPGRLIEPDPAFLAEGQVPRPLLWISDKPEAGLGLWERLYEARHETGLYPLLLDTLSGDDERPWHDGELSMYRLSEIDELSAEDVLREWWRKDEDDGDDDRLPSWNGLAAPTEQAGDPDAAAAEVVENLVDFREPTRIGLVPAARGADTITAMGWDGPCNFSTTPPLSAVLRSWEDRFGVRLVGVGFDTITVSVASPPSTLEQARAVAGEHYAFCPDNIDQGGMSFDEYASYLVGHEFWDFWWD